MKNDKSYLIPRVIKKLQKRIDLGELDWDTIVGDFENKKSIGEMCLQYSFTRTEVKVLREYYYGK